VIVSIICGNSIKDIVNKNQKDKKNEDLFFVFFL